MSMNGNLLSVWDGRLRSWLAAPDTIADDLYPEGDGEPTRSDPELDLDWSWHGIHYLLTQTAWGGAAPLEFLVRGGHDVGDEDLVYGPARAFMSAEVRHIWHALEPLTREVLAPRFDPERMNALEIYPDGWSSDRGEHDALEGLLGYYEKLRRFVADTAERGHGLLVWLS